MEETTKEYSNGEITVLWKPKKCIHAGECVKRLPEVYNPDKRPWISVENASTEELRNQIEACPSGALTYRMEGQDSSNDSDQKSSEQTKVEVVENGPLLVHGLLLVTDSRGNEEKKKRTTAFCRCGASNNKPYCDGEHNQIEFKG